MKEKDLSPHGKQIERALQEGVAEAIEEHRRAGRPIVVARDGKPVTLDPDAVRTVREERATYDVKRR
jgi:hypothetical protein